MNRANTLLLSTYVRRGLLHTVHWDLTYRCPLNCRHCYLDGRKSAELGLHEVLSVLSQLAHMKVFKLMLSGGETLLRRDLPEVLTAAREARFFVQLKTSGCGGDTDTLARVAKCRPNQVDISFYSDSAAQHDRVTGVPGSFGQALDTALRWQDLGLHINAVATPMKGFADGPARLLDGLRSLGLLRVTLNRVDNAICGTRDLSGLELDDAALLESMRLLAQEPEINIFGGAAPEPLCSAAVYSMYISPNGDVTPCSVVPVIAGSVRSNSVADIWSSSEVLARYRRLSLEGIENCTDCPDKQYCHYCFGRSFASTGDANQPLDVLCRLAAVRRRVAESNDIGGKA